MLGSKRGDYGGYCAYGYIQAPDRAGAFNANPYVIGIIEIDQDNITLRPSGITSKTGCEATPWLTRTGNEITLTMDGPHVFKGKKPSSRGNKRYI
ncbi:hypothetical protein [Budvicia aquatica]|uniref:Uncharacterized protein n=1 Tax=Budvicia aquatica TaxID=82979 RepID=A0A2C6DPB5_9GAMM|nr:hypothetical protein [Budvicia aquatica]PHI30641.1 hypothetical protein CRN84_15495 [Budvicia aquatica]